jgi:hypothetical protein
MPEFGRFFKTYEKKCRLAALRSEIIPLYPP